MRIGWIDGHLRSENHTVGTFGSPPPCRLRLVQLLAILVVAANAPAATYYVAKNGNNSNPGTQAQPWLTIQKAADTLVAGDTVYIKAGTYKEVVTPQDSGAPNQYITYAAYGNDLVVLDGENVRPTGDPRWGGLFQIFNHSYIKVQKLRAVNSAYAGFLAETTWDLSHHLVFENNSTSGTWSSGISVWRCANVVIDGNDIRRACQGDGDLQECLTVSNTDTFEIKNNHVYDRPVGVVGGGGEGICSKDANRNGKIYGNHVHDMALLGLYVDAWGSHEDGIEVYNNIVHDALEGISITDEINTGSLTNVRVFNNIVYNNRVNGIVISDNTDGLPTGDGPKQNIWIVNNTVFHNGYGTPGWGGGITVVTKNPASSNLVVRNNICSQNQAWQILRSRVIEARTTVEYNLLDGANDYADADDRATSGTSFRSGSPRFVNAAAYDFRLQAASPAIDAGSPTAAPTTDYTGAARPKDGDGNGLAAFDIGAYEYQRAATAARFWELFE